MGLNISNFLSGSSLSALSQVGATSSTIQAALSRAGATVSSIENLATNALDSAVSVSDFFGASSISAAVQDLIANRNVSSSINSFPDSKTAATQTNTTGGSTMTYPPDLGKYYITLGFYKYKRPAPMDKATLESRGSVTMPLPDNLVEDFQLSYEDKSLGIIGNVADNLQREHQVPGASAQRQLEAFALEGTIRGMNAITSAIGHFFGADGKTPVSLDANSLSGVAEQDFGATINPSLATLFGGIGFRRHQFKWLLAPKSESDSATIRDIIKFLKVNALPAFSKGVTNILDYPNICVPKLYPWASDQSTYMYVFKKCMIDSVNVNYNPMNSPAFFAKTTAPAMIQITVNLREIEYFTADDFGGSGSDLSGVNAFKQLTGGITSAIDSGNFGVK